MMTTLSARTLLALVLALTGIQAMAQPSTETAANPDDGKVFANVWRLRGEVYVTGKVGNPRKLREGSPVHVGERIRASGNGEAVLKTSDAGVVAVRPGAEFIPERYAAEGKSTDRQVLRLITGSLRVISGWISHFNRTDHRIVTPSATIGIRGTDHEPFVLPPDMANSTYRQGTYDKVNRGATSLEAGGGSILIEPGRVGFARDPNSAAPRTRALMTILLPSLLASVPEFYVPGSFDAELDRYSEQQERQNLKLADERRTQTKERQPDLPAATALGGNEPAPPIGCKPLAIAEYWLERFDRAIARRDLKTILGLFATDVVARATIRTADNRMQTLELNRDELVQSTLAAIANLRNYQQRRIANEARLGEGASETACSRIDIKSVVIEQGLMNDKPYRFESTETYVLELRNTEWLATRAATVQR